MKATKEKIENCQAYLTVEIDADEVAKATEGAYRRTFRLDKKGLLCDCVVYLGQAAPSSPRVFVVIDVPTCSP